jgi:hypothetical protein
MRYWWVNQNQTYQHEVLGGYLWSPKRNKGGGQNPFYDSMREAAPGDVVFSFAGTFIKAIGFVRSNGYEAPKPLEFGAAGAYWEQIGWRVDVTFTELRLPIRPADHINALRPYLPKKYSPLRENGFGLQGVYLTSLPEPMAGVLIDLIGAEAHALINGYVLQEPKPVQPAIGLAQWEEHELDKIKSDHSVVETEREALVLARRGQGLFKSRVMTIEKQCRITGVNHNEHLRASHCKPWRLSTNDERLNGENGLLLTPSADHLFDRGFISFEDNGDLLISPVAHHESLYRMGIDPRESRNVGNFSSGQRVFLKYHRDNEFLKSHFMASK